MERTSKTICYRAAVYFRFDFFSLSLFLAFARVTLDFHAAIFMAIRWAFVEMDSFSKMRSISKSKMVLFDGAKNVSNNNFWLMYKPWHANGSEKRTIYLYSIY